MKVSFEVSIEEATIAMMYCLMLGAIIESRRAFKNELNNYFYLHGCESLDDHECENGPKLGEATVLVERFFKN